MAYLGVSGQIAKEELANIEIRVASVVLFMVSAFCGADFIQFCRCGTETIAAGHAAHCAVCSNSAADRMDVQRRPGSTCTDEYAVYWFHCAYDDRLHSRYS